MIKEEIEKKIIKLTEDINKYNEFYYNKNTSLISDLEYDKLILELKELEEKYPDFILKDSPLKKVGNNLEKDNKFKKVKHKVPMLSLSNSYNSDDIKDFTDRIKINLKKEDIEYALELKLDGLSISIFYENGILKRAVTRGDGEIGEDVTENIKNIKSIPHKLKENISIEIRGEVVMPLSVFKKLNEERIEKGEEIFANPRNAASGTLRQINSKIVAERNLDAYFYFLVNAENYNFKKHSDSIDYLDNLGIKTTGVCEVLKSTDELIDRINYWSENRKKKDYETDGIVIKVNNLEYLTEIGYTAKSPKWAIAYKFPAERVTTIVKNVTWQVGRTGKLTPVAELEAVYLSGSIIRRASLHNFQEIQRKNILIGDRVFIEKAAEIIPQVINPVKEARNGKEIEILEPEFCPICNSKLKKEEGLVDIFCKNIHCPSKVQGYIEYFVSREAMNILGMGSKIVNKLLELGFIKNIVDIYDLKKHREELIKIDKMGEKSIDNLLKSIEESKNRPYEKLIYALGIPYVGKVGSKILAKESSNIENLIDMDYERLLQIDGIGEIMAKEIISYFQNVENLNMIDVLKKKGLNFKNNNYEKNENKLIFNNKTFLVTGTLKNYKREEIKKEIEDLGGKILSSVSKNLDYLIVGEKPGSKLDKARDIGVKILTEDEYSKIKTNLT